MPMVPGRLLAAATVALAAMACSETTPSGRSPEFDKAQGALEKAISETLDPSYSHPDFDAVEALFRQVPSSAPDYELAQGIAKEIHEQRARAKKSRASRESEADKAKEAADQVSKNYVADRRAREAEQMREEQKRAQEEARKKQEAEAAKASENPEAQQ